MNVTQNKIIIASIKVVFDVSNCSKLLFFQQPNIATQWRNRQDRRRNKALFIFFISKK
jgi:hypothetical protein